MAFDPTADRLEAAADAVALAMREHIDDVMDQYSEQHPLADLILSDLVDGSKMKGVYQEFPILTGAPGRARRISTGREFYGGTRRDILDNGTVHPTRIVYSWDQSNKDLSEAASDEGKMDNLIKQYAEAAMEECIRAMVKQIYTGAYTYSGADTGWEGLAHLNGDITTQITRGYETGMLQFLARDSQTTNYHGITRRGGSGGVGGWYNEFASISSLSSGGLRQISGVIKKTRQRSTGVKRQFLMTDLNSYLGYEDLLRDKTRLTGTIRGEALAGTDAVTGLVVHGNPSVLWFGDTDLDDSQKLVNVDADGVESDSATNAFSTAGTGIGYLLSKEHIKGFQAPQGLMDGQKKKFGWYVDKPQKIPRQPVYEYSMWWRGNFRTEQLRAHAAFVGLRNT